MSSTYNELNSKIAGKNPEEAKAIKKDCFNEFCFPLVTGLAFTNNDRNKPAGVRAIEAGLITAMMKEFKELYEVEIGSQVAKSHALYFY